MTNVVLAQSSILPKEPENQSSLNNVQTHDGSNTLLATCGRDLFHNHVTLTPDLIFIAWLAAAVVYTCTKFAVDSSSRIVEYRHTNTTDYTHTRWMHGWETAAAAECMAVWPDV